MNNGRPLTRKQTVRLMVAITILFWATDTLIHQWGFGAEIPATQPAMTEKFVPSSAVPIRGATLELRGESTIIGGELKLRQICRWAESDKALFEPIGDLVLARIAPQSPFRSISVAEIRGILRDAGVNIAAINFTGALSCTVARSDVEYDERNALQQWIDAKQTPVPPISAEIASTTPATQPQEQNSMVTLRNDLVNDLATRLGLPPETLQVDFKAQDEKTLNISKPLFNYSIEPLRAKSLGAVSWTVSIGKSEASEVRKVTIAAEARAWQQQVIAAKAVATRQIIQAEDLTERRALVDRLSDDPLLSLIQIVGQQAARELRPGIILTSKMIEPTPLVRVGDLVTVTLDQGTIQLKTVVKSMEGGVYGQTIRVKNETTRDVFQVVVTGPKTGTMNLAVVGDQRSAASPVASVDPRN